MSEFQSNDICELLANASDQTDNFNSLRNRIENELKTVESQTIVDYIEESGHIAALHNRINESDQILARMEQLLVDLQGNLSSISDEIVQVQKQSITMTEQLINRQKVAAKLGEFIDEILIANETIDTLLTVDVTKPQFESELLILNEKLNLMKEQNFREIRASQEIETILVQLRTRASQKIRKFLAEQIVKFRKPLSNYQIPQNVLLKSKCLFEFLLTHDRLVAQEICHEYIETMSKVYFSYFKAYTGRLVRLRFARVYGAGDLMGSPSQADDLLSRAGLFFLQNSHTPSMKNHGTMFTIGTRDDVLVQQLEAPILVPHVQQKNQFQFEALFRSEQYALVDNACREYLFISEFFMVRGSQAQNLFNDIMDKTLALLHKNLEAFVQETYDIFALFLSVHLVLKYQLMCHKRCVPALDRYWDKLQATIWPRFEYIFKLNIQSVRECEPAKFAKDGTAPHFITRRYAEFSAAIVAISENYPNDLVTRLLAELQEQIAAFLLAVADQIAQKTSNKSRLIFLINNYDMILNVLMERTKDTSKEADTFRQLLTRAQNEYVDEMLEKHFAQLVKCLATQVPTGNDFEQVVRELTIAWQKSFETINREILWAFPNMVTGSMLFQLTVTKFIELHARLQALLTPTLKAQLFTTQHIKIELKKYKLCY